MSGRGDVGERNRGLFPLPKTCSCILHGNQRMTQSASFVGYHRSVLKYFSLDDPHAPRNFRDALTLDPLLHWRLSPEQMSQYIKLKIILSLSSLHRIKWKLRQL